MIVKFKFILFIIMIKICPIFILIHSLFSKYIFENQPIKNQLLVIVFFQLMRASFSAL
jgi:hypothetical protein